MAREVSPSEEVRRMLDERGIEYTICMPWNDTAWEHGGTHFTANERFGKIYLQTSQESLTPEQAIAATVGEEHEMHICKRCGVAYELNIIDKGFGKPRFCPNCGFRKDAQ